MPTRGDTYVSFCDGNSVTPLRPAESSGESMLAIGLVSSIASSTWMFLLRLECLLSNEYEGVLKTVLADLTALDNECESVSALSEPSISTTW